MNTNDIEKHFYEVTAEDIKNALATDKKRETYMSLPTIFINGNEYAVAVNEEEANAAAGQYIKDSICYFNPSFLAGHSDVPEEVFEFLADKGFFNNEAYKSMIYDVDDFVDDAIDADGRGHFLNSYNGKEYKIGEYFLYQVD